MEFETLRWWRFTQYEIRDGYIRPTQHAELESYNPWIDFWDQKEVTSQKSLTRHYHALLELLDEIAYAPGEDGRAKDLTDGSKDKLATWCAKHGLLGVLLQRTRAVTLAARWTPLSEIFPGGASEPDKESPLVPAYTHISHQNTGWRRWKSGGWESEKLRKANESGRKKGQPLSMEAMRRIGTLPHVILQDLGKPRWKQEPLDATWATFFPDVLAKDPIVYEYPLPSTEEFWRLYCEPVSTFVEGAVMLRQAADRLRAMKPFADALESDIGSVAFGLDALHALVLPTSPALHIRDNGTFEQIWVPASLLGAYAMMLLQDLADQAPIYRCLVCNRLFTSKSPKAKYCSPRCRNTANVRVQRNKEKSKRTSNS